MPSEFDNMFADDAAPQLLAAFGEQVIRWPAGEADDAETVTAIVAREKLEQMGQWGGRRRYNDHGEQITHVVQLQFDAGQATHDGDRWVFDGFIWNAVRPLDEGGGMQTWLVERLQKLRTAKGGKR